LFLIDVIGTIIQTGVLITIGSVLSSPIEPVGLHGVTVVETKPIKPMWSAERHCRFHGLAIPYERDWEIVSENTLTHTRSVIPPAPGKVHDIAILINKKTCPGKEPERVFLSGSAPDGIWNYGGKGLGWKILLTSVGKAPEDQPKWLPQVMKVVEAAEPTQPFVKEFLDYSRAGTPEAQPTPTPEVAAQAEATAAESTETPAAQ
jgi:hypothetical protein